MTRNMKSAAVTLVLVSVVLGLNWAWQAAHAESTEPSDNQPAEKSFTPKTVAEIEIAVGEREFVAAKIGKVRVPRGNGMRIRAPSFHAFVLIPDGELRTFDIGKNICERTDAWIACKVERGSGIGVYVPAEYRLDLADNDHTVWYSVLYWNGEKYQYQEGKESPPRIIIPKGPGG